VIFAGRFTVSTLPSAPWPAHRNLVGPTGEYPEEVRQQDFRSRSLRIAQCNRPQTAGARGVVDRQRHPRTGRGEPSSDFDIDGGCALPLFGLTVTGSLARRAAASAYQATSSRVAAAAAVSTRDATGISGLVARGWLRARSSSPRPRRAGSPDLSDPPQRGEGHR
jgi:hypothetical protein